MTACKCSGLLALALGCGLVRATAGTDDYSSGFYSRGVGAAAYVDREDAAQAPFYLHLRSRWRLLPRITVSAAYEDNATLSSAQAKHATTVYAVPGLLLVYGQPGRTHLYTDAGMIIPLYRSSMIVDDKPSYLLVVGGMARTGMSIIHVRAGYRRLESLDTIIGIRMVKQDTIGEASVEYRFSTKSSAGVIGRAEYHDFEDPRYFDYWRYYGNGRLYHRMTLKSDVFLQIGVGHDDLQGVSGRSGDADFHDVSLGWRGRQSRKSRISGRIGYRWRRPVDDDLGDVNHIIAAVDAETTPFGLTTFSGELLTDIRPSITEAGFATVDQRATVGVSRRLVSERLRGQASLFYGITEYYGAEGRPLGITELSSSAYGGRKNEYWGYGLGMDWWLWQRFSCGLSYTYFENRSHRIGSGEAPADTSYSSGRWGLRASWNY